MNEYTCNNNDKIIRNSDMRKYHQCEYLYVKGSMERSTNSVHQIITYTKLCASPYTCKNKSKIVFTQLEKKCIICNKQTSFLENHKCLECNLTEMADNKASEIIIQEWAI
jgi:hypothetical protein